MMSVYATATICPNMVYRTDIPADVMIATETFSSNITLRLVPVLVEKISLTVKQYEIQITSNRK